MQIKPINRKKFTIVLALSFFIYGIILMVMFFLFSNWLIEKKEIEKFINESYLQAQSKEDYLALYLDNLSKSIKSIAYNPYFMSYVLDKSYEKQADFLFLTIMIEHDDYMQLRFLDLEGKETIRYQRDKIADYPYKSNKLQDKSDRYYFKESIKLKEGKIYTSKIDYNVENGKIERPFVPVFRLSMPIYFKGKKRGVLTINTFAKKIISLFTSSPTFNISIFSEDGYVIYYNGNFYDKKVNSIKITQLLPISQNELPKKGSNSIFKEKKIYIKSIKMGTENLFIALTPKPNTVINFKKEDYKVATIVLILLFISAFPLSYLLSRPTEKMFDIVTKQQKKLHLLTQTLEDRVAEKSEENAKKDRMLIHQARLAELGEMIGNIAHQWRHPLTRLSLILQNLKAMQRVKKLDSKTLETMLNSANEQIFFMSDTIDNFKDFYKLNEEKKEFSPKESYEKVIRMVGYNLKHNNITITYNQNENIKIYGNPNELSQVLLNIIMNAKDALIENHIKDAKIEINTFEKDNKYIIEIEDNAGGIPTKPIEDIFKPYFSTKGSKGTGIGLYMVKTIIQEKFKGKVWVENTKNGAKFVIELH